MRSNTVMDNNDPTLERLTDLEIKASFTDDLLDAINQTLYRQQQEIDRLRRDLQQLRELSNDAGSGTARSLLDDLPPHY
jgi:SlyX protein